MKDQLSALVDGELELANASHLITAIKGGGEMSEYWSHYHLIGDTMRGDACMNQQFSARVMHLLNAEPTLISLDMARSHLPKLDSTADTIQSLQSPQIQDVESPNKSNLNKLGFNKPSFNKYWSIAASVAAVMFVGVMVLQLQLSGSEKMIPVEIAQGGTNETMEYLQAHQEAAPSGSAYYIQNASFKDNQQQ